LWGELDERVLVGYEKKEREKLKTKKKFGTQGKELSGDQLRRGVKTPPLLGKES